MILDPLCLFLAKVGPQFWVCGLSEVKWKAFSSKQKPFSPGRPTKWVSPLNVRPVNSRVAAPLRSNFAPFVRSVVHETSPRAVHFSFRSGSSIQTSRRHRLLFVCGSNAYVGVQCVWKNEHVCVLLIILRVLCVDSCKKRKKRVQKSAESKAKADSQTNNKQTKQKPTETTTHLLPVAFLFVLVFLGPEGKKGNKDAKSAG